MATPITWRTIAGPNFDNSALGQGIAAFRSAGDGFSRFGEELLQAQDRADSQFTNQAILEALRTGKVNPALNPRADSARVYDSLLGLQKGESDLATARVNRRQTLADIALTQEETADKRYENTDEFRNLERADTQSQIDFRSASAATERENARLRGAEFNLKQDEANLLKQTRQGRDLINRRVNALRDEIATSIIQEEYPGQAQLSDAQINEVMQRATARAQGAEGRRLIRGEFDQTNLPEEAWANSIFGDLDTRTAAVQDALATERQARLEEAREQGREAEYRASLGDMSMLVYRDGTLQPTTEGQLKAEKDAISSDRKAIAVLTANGIPAERWSDDDKEALKLVRDMFPTASAFTQVIRNYVQNGKLRRNALLEAVAEVGEAVLQRAQLNANPDQNLTLPDPDALLQQAIQRAQQSANQSQTPPSSGTLSGRGAGYVTRSRRQ